jgi:hypothetical protein
MSYLLDNQAFMRYPLSILQYFLLFHSLNQLPKNSRVTAVYNTEGVVDFFNFLRHFFYKFSKQKDTIIYEQYSLNQQI